MTEQSKHSLEIAGRITDQNEDPIPGLSVQAFDVTAEGSRRALGEAITDESGRYRIGVDVGDLGFDAAAKDAGSLDVMIQAYAEGKLLGESSVTRITEGRARIHLRAAMPAAGADRSTYRVTGTVLDDRGGAPGVSVRVRAYDQGLRHRALLGEAQCGPDGRFTIPYDREGLLDPAGGRANLVVEAIDPGDEVVAATEIRFRARQAEDVRLKVAKPAAASEWDRINERLAVTLGQTPWRELGDEDLAYLEKAGGISPEHLAKRRTAAHAAAQSGLPEWFHYGLARNGMPAVWKDLLETPAARVRSAFEAARNARSFAVSERDADETLARFAAMQTAHALTKPAPGGRFTIGRLLDAARLDQRQQRAIAAASATRDLASPEAWIALRAVADIDGDALARAEIAFRLSNMVDDEIGVIAALLRDDRIKSLRDIARLYGPEALQAVAADTVPDADRRDQVVKRVYERVAAQHPDAAVACRLAGDERLAHRPAARILSRVLDTDPGFDLAGARVDAYVRDHAEELGLARDGDEGGEGEGNSDGHDKGGVESPESAAREDLKRVQRVFRLRPEPGAVAHLLRAGLDSSSAILGQGRERFLAKHGEALGADAAREIYQRAESTAARAMAVYARFSPILNPTPTPAAVGACPAELRGVPNYTTLFGSLDGCDCGHCESVYGAAAYLADLLAFLESEIHAGKDSLVASGLEGLTVRSFCDSDGNLVERRPRRPDILDAKLSCRNAETVLPYVDLVLEILERAVAPNEEASPQTTLTADQLAAQPEHIVPVAYEKLAAAVYPFALPFDLPHEEARGYLAMLGTSDAELRETLYPFANDDEPYDLTEIRRLQDTGVAAARFGLTATQWKLIAGHPLSPMRFPSAMWGYASLNTDWWLPLRVAETFLQRSGLEYADLLRLLTLKSVNPGGALRLRFEDLDDCDPRKIRIEGLDAGALAYIHRFLRMRRAIGVSLQEADDILVALAPGERNGRPDLNETFLMRLTHLLRLRDRFDLPLHDLLSWWSALGTADRNAPGLPSSRSFYETLFLAGRPGEHTYDLFVLNEQRTEVADTTPSMTDATPLAAISAAARLSIRDTTKLIETRLAGQSVGLTLDNISLVFRHASLARALHLSIEDYLLLGGLIGFDPFVAEDDADATTQTLRFIERADLVAASGFTLPETDYLLRQTAPYTSGATVAPADDWVDAALTDLHAALEPLAGLPVAPEVLAQMMLEALAPPASAILGVPEPTAGALLKHVTSPADPAESAGLALVRILRPAADDDPAIFPPDLAAMLVRRLHKAALVASRLALTPEEIEAVVARGPAAGWMDLAKIPVEGDVDAPAFDPWMRLVRLAGLCEALLPDQRGRLVELLDIAADYQPGTTPHANEERREYAALFAELSGVPAVDVEALVGRFDIGAISHGGGGILRARFPEQFADERLPLRILAAARLARRLGAGVVDVDGWVQRPGGLGQGAARTARIQQALRSRLGDLWDRTAKGLRDPLRERQRDALVAYLLNDWNLAIAEDLFDHFLIDVEMSPCMMTSRIVQASASVQMFVQRVLMNLEPGLVMSEEGAEQWEWMKNYRVWEANRKIFLYPENWIEPTLRDDKTPFFRELEEELMQGEVSNDAAETAVLHYLEKLHDVARLQVCGQYLERGNPVVLHLFARTRDVPHHYYYRRGTLEVDLESLAAGGSVAGAFDAGWTPWERVDVEVEGDHLIPIVYNRRLYLFWPIFSSEDEAPMTHTLQTILGLYGQLFRLLTTIGDLVRGLAQGIGISAIGGITNGIIQMLFAVQDGINQLPAIPGFDPLDLLPMRDAVRDIRTSLLGIFGVPASASSDVTQTIIDGAHLTTYADLAAVFNDVLAMVQRYEDYLLSFLPAKRLEVQLAWSEHRGDAWSAKKVSSSAVAFRDLVSLLFESLPDLPGLRKGGIRRLFTFHARVEAGNELIVHCNVALPTSLLDPTTYTAGEWLAKPLEIGYFRMNSCSGRLEAVDTPERLGFIDLIGQAISAMLLAVDGIVDNLRADRQLLQRGEPVTPDDDPNRPSTLRHLLDAGSLLPALPHHFRAGAEEDAYRVLARHQETSDLAKLFGFFYHDSARAFFCFPWHLPENNRFKPAGSFGWIFFPFYHPYSCALLANLRRFGVPGLYDVRFMRTASGAIEPAADGQPLQIALKNDDYFGPPEYAPANGVYNPPDGPRPLRPVEEIDFSTIGPYSQYNWEVFFHIPFLVATRLTTDQKFREAQRWFHYIFDPTDSSRSAAPAKFWRTRPFVEATAADYERQQIDELMQMLNAESQTPGLQELEWAVRRWRNDAFNPHLVARARSAAFQKAVVARYIDNLIAWGDSLFRRETREAVNEATQLYVLAAKLLGPRPRRIPKGYAKPEYSYAELTDKRPLDAFSNALVEIESLLPASPDAWYTADGSRGPQRFGRLDGSSLARVDQAWRAVVKSRSLRDILVGRWRPGARQEGEALYFCVPPNEDLLRRWDLVADRLFKIRHCQNIEGQALSLSLLGSPIDPAILVRARAAGVEISDLLSDLEGPTPHYRFAVLAQKATEVCGEVKSLGAAMLAVMEKRDGEALAFLRNTHEIRVLDAIRRVKQLAIEEAEVSLDALRRTRDGIELRRSHYAGLLAQPLIPEEVASLGLNAASLILQAAQFGTLWGASAASLIPNIKAGFVTTLGTTYGGQNVSGMAEHAASAIGQLASILSSAGGLVSTVGGFRRRAEEWLLQLRSAENELRTADRQIAAGEIRLQIAQTDLENHGLQSENAREVSEFMHSKFTNEELYDWMLGRTSTLYFQAYHLAHQLARTAERAFAFELGEDSPALIQPDYWDSLKKGLLAGEQLGLDLKRLEAAYIERNRREYELTKHVSLLSLDPLQLLALRGTGKARFTVPEGLFDMDYPGHYFRRIKSVSVTIPCVTGPYAGVNATLRLLNSRVRLNQDLTGGYASTGDDDPRFLDRRAAVRSMAASSGQNDSGLFELNFRDDRYLPFEGEGAVSEWELTLNREFAQFDFDSISDVILHVRYTAREGSQPFADAATGAVRTLVADGEAAGCARLFSIRHDFPTEWARFRNQPPGPGERHKLSITVRPEHYPYWSLGRLNAVGGMAVLVRSTSDPLPAEVVVADRADTLDAAVGSDALRPAPALGRLYAGVLQNVPVPASPTGDLSLYFEDNALSDVFLVIGWQA